VADGAPRYMYDGLIRQAWSIHKFTGKERDSESNLDYFGARHDASSMGRFMTPDWAAKPTSVPHANFGNPQSLNLYSYVANNPLSRMDTDGHGWWDKLGNFFGDAGCWCEGAQATQAILANHRQWLINNVAQNSGQAGALRAASASQINGLYGQWKSAISQAQRGNELIHDISEFRRAENGALVLYRGGGFSNVRANEYKLDADGNVRGGADPTARGPSLFDDPAKIPPRFTEINTVTQEMLPPELMTKPWGQQGHFEIVPRETGMSPGRFLDFLRGILEDVAEDPIE
jgi:RHS repeat-associated protein